MYHRIVSDICPVPGRDAEEMRFAIPLEEFIWQLDCIVSMGLRGMSVGDGLAAVGEGGSVPPDGVILTFDDGNRSDFMHALPILKERNFTATFFVCTSRIGAEGGLGNEMIEELALEGMEIGSHGMTHRFLPLLNAEEEMIECGQSKQMLAEVSRGEIKYFAPPGGRYKHRTIRLLERLGYEAVCTSDFGYNPILIPPYVLKRIPIRGGTGRNLFHTILSRSVVKLLPGYGRAASVKMIRKLLGEKLYARARGIGRER